MSLSVVADHMTDEDNDLIISVSSDDIDLTYFGEQYTFILVCGDDSLVQQAAYPQVIEQLIVHLMYR